MSDLHFGAGRSLDDEPEGAGIRELVERIQPELVIASGDLTHGGRAEPSTKPRRATSKASGDRCS